MAGVDRHLHDMRRSAARNMSRRGIYKGEIKKLAGWKTDSMFDRYNVIDGKDLARAAGLLDGVVGDVLAAQSSTKKPAIVGMARRSK